MLLEELITSDAPKDRASITVHVKLDSRGRNKKGVTSLFGREKRFAAVGLEGASTFQIELSVAGDDRTLQVEVSLRASIADGEAAERAGVTSVRTGWLNAIQAEIKSAFTMGANGRDFKSLLALCGTDAGARAFMAALSPGFHGIGLSLSSAVAQPLEPLKPVVDFSHPFEIPADGVRISPDISFSLERDPDRADVYYTSLATSDVIKNKLHADIRDHLTGRYSLQQWRYDPSAIRDQLTQVVNEKAADFGRRLVSAVMVRTAEERPNKPVAIEGQASFPLSDTNRSLILHYSTSLNLSDAATWERIKRNDPAANDMSVPGRQAIERALSSLLRSLSKAAALNILTGDQENIAQLTNSVQRKLAETLGAYGWSCGETSIVPAPLGDSLLTNKGGRVESRMRDYTLAFEAARAAIECEATVEVIDAELLLSTLKTNDTTSSLVRARIERAIESLLRSTTPNAFFDFTAGGGGFDIASDVQIRLAEDADNALSQAGIRLGKETGTRKLSGNTIEARIGSAIVFRLGSNPVLRRLHELRNGSSSVVCDETVTDIHGVSYQVRFDIRFILQDYAEAGKDLVIDHALKHDMRDHMALIKQTISDACIGILRRIPANYYYRDNLRASMLDGFIATLAMSRVATYHGLVIDIPPGNVTIQIKDDNNAKAAAYGAIRANQQSIIESLSSTDPLDWNAGQKVEMSMANSGKLQSLIKDGYFGEGGLGGEETYEGLRENLYPQLQYIAEDEKARNALTAFLDRGYGQKKLAGGDRKAIDSPGENTAG